MYVRGRDGPKRIEQAYRILIDAKEANPDKEEERLMRSGDLREGLDRAPGARADHRKPARGPEGLGRGKRPRAFAREYLHRRGLHRLEPRPARARPPARRRRGGAFDVVAVLSPDRLARKYAYQVLLLDELRRAGCEVVFVQHPVSDDPNDQLLLQIQGGDRRVRAGGARASASGAASCRRRAPGSASAHGRPTATATSPSATGARPSGRRRGRGRGRPDALRLARRRADDDPPDPQAPQRRPLAAALRQASVVDLGGAPHPQRPGLRRHGLRQPLRLRAGREAAPRPRAAGGENDLPPAQAARGVDRHPGPGDHRRGDPRRAQEQLARNAQLSFRHNTKHAYLLRCLLTCGSCGLAMFGTTHSATERQPERRYYKCAGKDPIFSARGHNCTQRPAKAGELEEAVWEHIKGLMRDPGHLQYLYFLLFPVGFPLLSFPFFFPFPEPV